MRHGNLFVISGPSGAGKGTLVARLLREIPDAWVSMSVTTRKPREGEVDGVHYRFASPEEFQELVDEDGLLEWATYGGNCCSTPRATVEEHIACGDRVIRKSTFREIPGARQVPFGASRLHRAPSLDVLEARLRGRGTETEEAIATRMETARVELSVK
ncbi:MAG: guanylate kinase [Eggerthella lenta]